MSQNNQNIKRTNPNAMVFIYNYRDRMGDAESAKNIKDQFEVDQIILNTVSLLNVTTTKTKSSPAGTFEFRLAPTKNWVTAITPGSWCIILMSNSAINDKAKYGGGRVDEKSFKMLGRIESVRGVIEVDQATGARKTQYVVQGADWGTIFNSRFYVDPLNRSGSENPVGVAERFGFEEYLKKAVGYEPWKTGEKANPIPPNLKRAKTEASKKQVEETDNFMNLGFVKSVFEANNIEYITALPTVNADGTSRSILQVSDPDPVEEDTTETTADAKTADAKTDNIKTPLIKLPSAADAVNAILKLWGRSDPATSAVSTDVGLLAKSQQQFKLPKKAAEYMQFKDKAGESSDSVAQLLHQITGKLIGQDVYSNVDRSAGIINFQTILGEHAIWQVLNDNNNNTINELIPEIRFEKGKAKLALYNRVRPFAIKEDGEILSDKAQVGDGGGVKANDDLIGPRSLAQIKKDEGKNTLAKFYLSKFQRVRTKVIDLNDVISCNFGTNWRDKYNFIEVNIDRSLFKEVFAKDVKLESQFKDADSIGRDGLQSMMASFSYIPQNEDGIQSPLDAFVYKYALKEWYFNTHKMLNGNLQVIGQDQYIQVGDNIRIKAEVLGPAKNISAQQKASRHFTYLTAHVESISHTAQVDPNGARTFTTNINFVRGIITDINGKLIALPGNAGAVDQDASKVTPTVEKNKGTLGTSGSKDPDRQKLKGK